MADYPKSKNWEALKKKYKIPNGAVKGIKMAKEIDAFHNAYDNVSGPTASKKRVPIAEALENKMSAYITALSKNKKAIKLYDGFEKEFLKDYLGKIHFLKNDLKRYDADAKLYQAEIAKFFSAVHRLEANKAKVSKDDIEKFKSGPLRGLSALGKSVKNIDPREIDGWLGTINDGVQKLPASPTPTQLSDFVDITVKTADEVAKLARGLGLVK